MFGLMRKKKYNELFLAYEECQKDLAVQEAINEELRKINEDFVERWRNSSIHKLKALQDLNKRWDEIIKPAMEKEINDGSDNV